MTSPANRVRETRLKNVREALVGFTSQPLETAARRFWDVLGYASDRTLDLSFEELLDLAPQEARSTLQGQLASLGKQVGDFAFLFQLTAEDIRAGGQSALIPGTYQESNIESYIFVAVRLKADAHPSRKDLANAARILNRAFRQPVLTLFVSGEGAGCSVSLTAIQRRTNKRDAERDVLGKVTLVYDVQVSDPRRSQLDILADLHVDSLLSSRAIDTFVQLERAWVAQFAVEELNKRFYQELSNWFYWAAAHPGVSFPDEREPGLGSEAHKQRRHAHLIRLITRLLFVWFLREKNLVPAELFQPDKLKDLLREFDAHSSTDSDYYQGVLQNLFFATLNTEMGEGRTFLEASKGGYNAGHGVHTLYRYPELFQDPQQAIAAFADVPFLNGGLFECLDQIKDAQGGTAERRVDGFSAKEAKRAHVANEVFFLPAGRAAPELNDVYGTKNKKYTVRGLVDLLDAYKFTTTENTPIEEEVALDPELLGKVFENLLAAVNPDDTTGDTARKKTGSFYTPRYVVDDMTDDALLGYLRRALGDTDGMDARLGELLAYTPTLPAFTQEEREVLVRAVDELDILDPACGSGAFPMGVLHKLVHVLSRLDPHNTLWLAQQKEREIGKEVKRLRQDKEIAGYISEEAIRQKAVEGIQDRIAEIERVFDEQYAHLDYARKLFLIENCIYGVDLQPIAVQISKLRCFISLIVDQRPNSDPLDNRGILTLPNLESQFVAANTLYKLGMSSLADSDETVKELRAQLKAVRHEHFLARRHRRKMELRARDREIRQQLAGELVKLPGANRDDADLLASFDPYDQNASAPFFDPQWMFNQEKFDVVIGNPPYVRQERIKDDKPWLRSQYSAFFDGKADLFVYFFARGLELLDTGGVLTYICSNKFFRSGYGQNLRTQLTRKTITRLIDFGDAPVFDAIAFPSIIAVQEGRADADHSVCALNWNPEWATEDYPAKMRQESFGLEQSSLKPAGWQIETGDKLELLDKLRRVGKPLGEYVGGRFYRGILTGLNEAFVVDRATRDALIAEHPSSAEVLKPYLRGRDVKRWTPEYQDLWLIFTRRGTRIDNFPAIKKHLEKFKDRLMPGVEGGRKAGSYEWYEVQDNLTYHNEFEHPKMILGRFMNHSVFSYDDRGMYNNDALYIIPESSKFLVAVMNSKVGWFMIYNSTTALQNGYIQAYRENLAQIRIPEAGQSERSITGIVDALLLLSSQPRTPQQAVATTFFEAVLDALVYELYLPEELHAAGYFPYKVISAAAWPELTGNAAQDLQALERVFQNWYDPTHPVRQLTHFLDSVLAVRIIAGLDERSGNAGAEA